MPNDNNNRSRNPNAPVFAANDFCKDPDGYRSLSCVRFQPKERTTLAQQESYGMYYPVSIMLSVNTPGKGGSQGTRDTIYVPGACVPQIIEQLKLAVACAPLTDDVKLEKAVDPLIEDAEDFGDEDFDTLFASEILDADEAEEIACNFLMLNTDDEYRVDKTKGYSFKKFTFKEAPTSLQRAALTKFISMLRCANTNHKNAERARQWCIETGSKLEIKAEFRLNGAKNGKKVDVADVERRVVTFT